MRVVENDHTLIFAARRLADNGFEAWGQVLERGYEGYVGKDPESPYKGGRTLSWLKLSSQTTASRSAAGARSRTVSNLSRL